MVFINIVGIGILAIFLLFVLPKKKKGTSDYLLILTICLFGAMLLSDILIRQGLTATRYLFQLISTNFLFVAFLLYGMVLIDEEHRLKKEWWWIPSYAVVFTIFLLVDFLFLNDYSTPERINRLYVSPPLLYQVFYKAMYLYIILTLTWFLRKINSYSKKLKDHYSFIEPIHLNWFRNFTYTHLFLTILGLFLFLFLDFGILSDINIPFAIIYCGIVLSLFYLCYHGIKQYALAEFHSSSENDDLIGDQNTQSKKSSIDTKYGSSSLSEAEMDMLFKRVQQLLKEEKAYLSPQLKIQDLAEQLDVTKHKISQTINTKAKKSFFDYVNEFRVSHFKSLLSDPKNRKYTILALGIESGFNSKATLNRTFKEYTGNSPKAFQKSQVDAQPDYL